MCAAENYEVSNVHKTVREGVKNVTTNNGGVKPGKPVRSLGVLIKKHGSSSIQQRRYLKLDKASLSSNCIKF